MRMSEKCCNNNNNNNSDNPLASCRTDRGKNERVQKLKSNQSQFSKKGLHHYSVKEEEKNTKFSLRKFANISSESSKNNY